MRIFHVLTHFMPRQVAGTEMYVYALQHQLQQMGMEGGVIIPGFSDAGEEAYQYEDIHVYSYAQPAAFSDEEIKGLAAPYGIGSFRRLLEKVQPDILHFHDLSGANGITVFHLEVVKSLRIPLLFTMHLAGYVCATGTLLKNQEQHCSGVIDLAACTTCSFRHQQLSPFAATLASTLSGVVFKTGIRVYQHKGRIAGLLGRYEMLSRHQKRLQSIAAYGDVLVTLNEWFAKVLIQNGVSAEKVRVVEQALPFALEKNCVSSANSSRDEGLLRLVFVGRIYPAKGLHLLLEALAASTIERYSLDIYGPANDEEYLQRCKGLIRPGSSVRFCGVLQPGKTATQLQQYHLLCLPSCVTEMAPLVIQEAFAAGIPVLASDVAGNAAMVQHNYNGLLFEVNNILSLSEQLKRIVEEEGLYRRLQEGVHPPRSFELVAAEYIALYRGMMKEYKK